jgi:hypothetical protein
MELLPYAEMIFVSTVSALAIKLYVFTRQSVEYPKETSGFGDQHSFCFPRFQLHPRMISHLFPQALPRLSLGPHLRLG